MKLLILIFCVIAIFEFAFGDETSAENGKNETVRFLIIPYKKVFLSYRHSIRIPRITLLKAHLSQTLKVISIFRLSTLNMHFRQRK